MINDQPKSSENAVRLWDFSPYSDLTAHAPEDDLDHDHIPSAGAMRKHKKQWQKEVYEYEEDYEGQNNELVKLATTEGTDDWWTIALLHEWHKNGLTYAENANAQETLVTRPFYDEMVFYLALLEQELSNKEYLKALGAFRYLYRC